MSEPRLILFLQMDAFAWAPSGSIPLASAAAPSAGVPVDDIAPLEWPRWAPASPLSARLVSRRLWEEVVPVGVQAEVRGTSPSPWVVVVSLQSYSCARFWTLAFNLIAVPDVGL